MLEVVEDLPFPSENPAFDILTARALQRIDENMTENLGKKPKKNKCWDSPVTSFRVVLTFRKKARGMRETDLYACINAIGIFVEDGDAETITFRPNGSHRHIHGIDYTFVSRKEDRMTIARLMKELDLHTRVTHSKREVVLRKPKSWNWNEKQRLLKSLQSATWFWLASIGSDSESESEKENDDPESTSSPKNKKVKLSTR